MQFFICICYRWRVAMPRRRAIMTWRHNVAMLTYVHMRDRHDLWLQGRQLSAAASLRSSLPQAKAHATY